MLFLAAAACVATAQTMWKLDEIAELDDKEGMTKEERKEKEEELSARFLMKLIKIQQA